MTNPSPRPVCNRTSTVHMCTLCYIWYRHSVLLPPTKLPTQTHQHKHTPPQPAGLATLPRRHHSVATSTALAPCFSHCTACPHTLERKPVSHINRQIHKHHYTDQHRRFAGRRARVKFPCLAYTPSRFSPLSLVPAGAARLGRFPPSAPGVMADIARPWRRRRWKRTSWEARTHIAPF